MKFTVTVIITGTGTPLSRDGVYSHWRSASRAAWSSRWLNAAVPARVGMGNDGRELGGATDYARIQVPR